MAEPKRLPNGRWKVRYRDPQGRPRSKVCDTKGEARAFVQEVGHAGRAKEWVAPKRSRVTLAAWAKQYMSTVVHLRPITVWLYERELQYILRRFGSWQLGQLESLVIQKWLSDLLAGGTAPSSVLRRHQLLRRLLQVAVDKGMLAKNPCAGVQPPRAETNEMPFPDTCGGGDLEHVAPAYAVTVHKGQGLTVDQGVLVVDRSTSAEHLYVGMTRGRHHNLACVITEPAGDEHQHRQPPTPGQVLAAALRRTSSEKSATESLREELDHLGKAPSQQPAAAIIESLHQAQQHTYHQTIRRQAQRQMHAFPAHGAAPTVSVHRPEL